MAMAENPAINLMRGWPSPSLLPTLKVRAASLSILNDPESGRAALTYGPDLGYQDLREELAKWLSNFYGSVNDPERICVTGGASQNLASILQVYTDPLYTLRIWMVAPSYFLACRIFVDSGFANRLRAVPEDEDGIDIAYLEEKLHEVSMELPPSQNILKPKRPWCKLYRHVFYAVPTFSNPSGKTMSLARRQQLVKLARKYDALIITDDVYDFLQWSTNTTSRSAPKTYALLPRIVDIDREMGQCQESDGFGNAVSNGSFSKIVGPGVRTGWAEGTEKFAFGLSQLGSSRSGGAPSQIAATFMAQLLKSGDLQNHISEVLQPAYASRYRTMLQAIQNYLIPLGILLPQTDFQGTFGGYFIWLSLPKPLLASDVARKAKAMTNLTLGDGEIFKVSGDEESVDLDQGIRLCFSWEDEEALVEGVKRLGNVVEEMLELSN